MTDDENAKQPREIALLATVGLVTATLASVAGLVWGVVVSGDSSAALVSIASICTGGLIALAGGAAAKRAAVPPEKPQQDRQD